MASRIRSALFSSVLLFALGTTVQADNRGGVVHRLTYRSAGGGEGADVRARMRRGEGSPLDERLDEASRAYRAVVGTERKRVPAEIRNNAKCIAVFPNLTKAAFLVGGYMANGVATCRTTEGAWSKIGYVEMGGGSIGLQAGYEKSDLVLFLMDEQSKRAIERGRIAVGADIAVTAGTYGEGVKPLSEPRRNVVAYTQSQGAFIGLSLTGTRISPDEDAQERAYDDAHFGTLLATAQTSEASSATTEFYDAIG